MSKITEILGQLEMELEGVREREAEVVAEREGIERAIEALSIVGEPVPPIKAKEVPAPRAQPAKRTEIRPELDLSGAAPKRGSQTASIIEFVSEHGKAKASDLAEAGICDPKRAGIALCNLVAAGKIRKLAPGLYAPLAEG